MPFQLPFKADTQWLLLQPNYPAMTSAAQKVGLSQSIGYFFLYLSATKEGSGSTDSVDK